MRAIETRITDLIAGLAPWLAPIPTAYLVGRATLGKLGWPLAVAICAALIVESLGLTATNTALTLYQYNRQRRKTDPAAPFGLAAGLVGAYVAVAVGLTVALDVAPSLAHYAPAIWPALSLTGVTLLALRSDHARRLDLIQADKQERRDARRAAAQESAQAQHKTGTRPAHNGQDLDAQTAHNGQLPKRPAAGRAVGNTAQAAQRAALLEKLLEAYANNPDLGATEAARRLGVHRNSIYNYTDDLITAGRLHRNGHGWEVRA
jgi:heme exporter protein D